jgi:proteasome lid subunit RPN8/RPN11
MVTTAERAAPRETGGILLGHRDGSDVHVERCIVVPDQQASGHTYVRSYKAAQRLLDEALGDRRRQLMGWVGEWHSHPNPGGPSPRDLRELSRLAREDGQAVALVVLVRKKAQWTPQGRVAIGWLPRAARVETVVIA